MPEEILYGTVVKTPRKLTADRRSNEAWAQLLVKYGPRAGEEVWFTGPVFEMCKVFKKNIDVRLKGEFHKKGVGGACRAGFHVCKISNLTVAPDAETLVAIGDYAGVMITEPELAACSEALGVTATQDILASVLTKDGYKKLVDVVGADVAQRLVELEAWQHKSEIDAVESLFRACGLWDNVDCFWVWQAVRALKARASRYHLSVADLICRNPYVLAQVWSDHGLVERVAESILDHTEASEEFRETQKAMIAAIAMLKRQMRRGHSFVLLNQVHAAMCKAAGPEAASQAWKWFRDYSKSKTFGTLCIEKDGTNISLREIMEDAGVNVLSDSSKTLRAVYAPGVYWSERDAAKLLTNVVVTAPKTSWDDTEELVNAVQAEAAKDGCEMDEEQKSFIRSVAEHKITVLVGEAGTGKTQVLRWLIMATSRHQEHCPAVLAPTALAAWRVAERTLGSGSTIHRYASIWNNEDADIFVGDGFSNGQKKSPGLVIVDECSMLGPVLLAKLLRQTDPATRYVFAGDPAQLPPVGPGGTFQALIRLAREKTPGFGYVELTRNFRVESGSEVYRVAREVRQGGAVPDGLAQVEVKIVADANEAIEACVETVSRVIEAAGSAWPSPEELMVLTPHRSRVVTVDKLNNVLSARFGGGAPDLIRVGTPVVAKRNDYCQGGGMVPRIMRQHRHPDRTRDVYNGTPGIVTDVRVNGVMEVQVTYRLGRDTFTAWYYANELEYFVDPAYALTVHKAQGGQARVVVLVLVGALTDRARLYTAISRCKDDPAGTGRVVIITTQEFLDAPYAINRNVLVMPEEDNPDDPGGHSLSDIAVDDKKEPHALATTCLSGFYQRVKREFWQVGIIEPFESDEWSFDEEDYMS